MLHETRDVIIHIAHLNKDNTLVYYGSSAKLMLLNIICLNVICSVTTSSHCNSGHKTLHIHFFTYPFS